MTGSHPMWSDSALWRDSQVRLGRAAPRDQPPKAVALITCCCWFCCRYTLYAHAPLALSGGEIAMELAYYTLQFHVYTAKVVHGARAYNVELINDELIEVVEIIPTELRHQLSKSNLKRAADWRYLRIHVARPRASKTRKVPPLPPPRCRYATAFHLACAWHRASRRTRRGIARPEIAERKSTTTARVSA